MERALRRLRRFHKHFSKAKSLAAAADSHACSRRQSDIQDRARVHPPPPNPHLSHTHTFAYKVRSVHCVFVFQILGQIKYVGYPPPLSPPPPPVHHTNLPPVHCHHQQLSSTTNQPFTTTTTTRPPPPPPIHYHYHHHHHHHHPPPFPHITTITFTTPLPAAQWRSKLRTITTFSPKEATSTLSR